MGLNLQAIAQKAGYIYIYLSNESKQRSEVYFDDMTITQTLSPIISAEDYYPFGLSFNQQTREGTQDQRYGFQGQEHQKDLDLGWVQFKWRMHNPSIGRFFNVDPLASDYVYNSPYAFSENHVTTHIELEGLEAVPFMKEARQFENSVKSFQKGIGDAQKAAGKFISNLFSEGDGSGDLPGGISSTMESGGASPVKSGSKNALGASLELDILLPAIGGAGAGRFEGKVDLSIPEAFSKVSEIVQVVSEDDKSDTKSENTKNSSTGTTSEAQSTDGINPIKGSEADSVIRLYYNDFDVNEVPRDTTWKKVHRKTNTGRTIKEVDR